MKTLLVGEAPARSMAGKCVPAFSSASGRRLGKLLGVDVTQEFATRNLLDYWPGSGGKGSEFHLPEAKLAARLLVKRLSLAKPNAELRIMLAGQRVAKAFRVRPEIEYLEWSSLYLGSLISLPAAAFQFQFAVIPHPSGVNRWWNSEENTERARIFLSHELRGKSGKAGQEGSG